LRVGASLNVTRPDSMSLCAALLVSPSMMEARNVSSRSPPVSQSIVIVFKAVLAEQLVDVVFLVGFP